MAWEYKREEQQFELLPEGKYRVRIASAEKKKSKSDRDMLALTFEVSGYNRKLFHNIVFLDDKPQITNRNLTQFFDSFSGIKDGDFDTSHWVGQVGACTVKHEEWNGEMRERVGFFISADKAKELPAWVEPAAKATASAPTYGATGAGFEDLAADDDLPF